MGLMDQAGVKASGIVERTPALPTPTPDACGLTDDEQRVLSHLADAWNGFLELFIEHSSDLHEFQSAIHAAQNVIAFRVAKRANPEVWSNGAPSVRPPSPQGGAIFWGPGVG